MLRFVIVLTFLCVAVFSTKIEVGDEHTLLRSADIATEINAMGTSWKATVSDKFVNQTVASFKRYLGIYHIVTYTRIYTHMLMLTLPFISLYIIGTVLRHDEGYIPVSLEKTVFATADSDIPTSFDAREYFSSCSSIIGHVRDQSSCGSCWAHSGVEAFNDRWCITTKDDQTLMSTEDTTACCTGFTCSMSKGCNGGQPAGVWNWLTKTGVSSGGDYGSTGACKAYSLESCAHHVEVEGMVSCSTLPEYPTPECTSTCSDSTYGTAYANDKHKASSSYSIKGVSNIQKELMEKGSISVAFSVYEDFESKFFFIFHTYMYNYTF